MPKAVCKFEVTSVEPLYGDEKITLSTVYDPEDPEDTKFSARRPGVA